MALAAAADAAPTREGARPGAAHPDGLIGPNSVIQLAEALGAREGEAAVDRLFERAGLAVWRGRSLDAMIPEAVPAALFDALFAAYPQDDAQAIAADAGRRTADYVMAHRIPGPVKTLLRLTPAPIAARLLLTAIGRNAWTFAGSGVFTSRYGGVSVIAIAGNPIAMPGCVWHAAVFTRLFRRLVSKKTTIRHPACRLAGDEACRFDIRLR
ncbi:MAG: bacteriochlorophyll 4-vinyl reductase [Marivibrio sp.]|uniref:bacteriochlorophyll 4-vinyl reductase n=1 Tax=Marivibrio sp. TaxID=2039719 RepID=UPI0032EF5498